MVSSNLPAAHRRIGAFAGGGDAGVSCKPLTRPSWVIDYSRPDGGESFATTLPNHST
ncbi:hypothetical protein [Nocardia sp. NPDC049707]|uniref:hypothetical protein n=1 Tax=Nocardia sp. NPDC049707 TaxID=3154735 RepID=UPI003442BEF5